MYIIFMIAAWNIFEKAGEAGWKAIIPIWNVYILYKITWGIGFIIFADADSNCWYDHMLLSQVISWRKYLVMELDIRWD